MPLGMFGNVDDQVHAGWQLRAVRALNEILPTAYRLKLAPLAWTVTSTAMIVGRVSTLNVPRAEVEKTFADWAALTNGQVSSRRAAGRTILRSEGVYPTDQLVKIIVTVDLDDEEVEQ